MSGKVLITGTSRGLGYGLVEGYLTKGFVVYACARNVNEGELVELKERHNENLHIITMDVSVTDAVISAAREVSKTTDSLDIIINNAAAHPVDTKKLLEEISVDNCMDIYSINALGPLRVVQAFLPFLEKGKMKTVINITSESGSIGDCRREKEYAYCMSKAALNMESVLLQNYLKPRSIKVLAIHPGWIRTKMGGPRGQLSIFEGADNIIAVIDKLHGQLEGPVFIDSQGKKLNY